MTDGGLRKIYRKYLPHVHWTSIESPMTQSGIPDTNYCCNGNEGWIENKIVHHAGKVRMQPGQPMWLERRARAGGKVFIAVRWHADDDALWLLAPQAGRLLMQSAALPDLPAALCLGHWQGGPAHWQWPKIGKILSIT